MRIVVFLLLAVLLAKPVFAEQRLFMLDFVFLNKDMALSARDAYNSKAAPIAARHGVRLQATLDPVQIVIGPRDLARLDLWTLPDPGALKAWGDDAEYKAMQTETLAVHDVSKLTLYLAREMSAFKMVRDANYWVEFLSFNKTGFKGPEFSAYQAEIDGIAAQSGMNRVATFGKVGRILGQGYEAHWMNIYSVDDPEKLQAHLKNPRFVELETMRKKLFDLDKSIVAVFKSR